FTYELVEQLGGDAESLRTGMLYRDVFGKNQ
ncbi:TPA: DJ-1 family protein, partial [Streptococcus pneumoniae]|nr:DJ-1 family protein [Streptococcus pneumoniae]